MAIFPRRSSQEELPDINKLRADTEPFSLDPANKKRAHQVALRLVENIGLTRRLLLPFDAQFTNDFLLQLQFIIERPVRLPTGIKAAATLASPEFGSAIISLNGQLEQTKVETPTLICDLNLSLVGLHHAIKADVENRQGVIPQDIQPQVMENLLTVRQIVPEVFGKLQ